MAVLRPPQGTSPSGLRRRIQRDSQRRKRQRNSTKCEAWRRACAHLSPASPAPAATPCQPEFSRPDSRASFILILSSVYSLQVSPPTLPELTSEYIASPDRHHPPAAQTPAGILGSSWRAYHRGECREVVQHMTERRCSSMHWTTSYPIPTTSDHTSRPPAKGRWHGSSAIPANLDAISFGSVDSCEARFCHSHK